MGELMVGDPLGPRVRVITSGQAKLEMAEIITSAVIRTSDRLLK